MGYFITSLLEDPSNLGFENVPLTKLPEVAPELRKALEAIVSGATAWDSARLQTVVNRRVLEQCSQVENSLHDAVAFIVFGSLFYNHSVEDLDMRFNGANQFRKMLDQPKLHAAVHVHEQLR